MDHRKLPKETPSLSHATCTTHFVGTYIHSPVLPSSLVITFFKHPFKTSARFLMFLFIAQRAQTDHVCLFPNHSSPTEEHCDIYTSNKYIYILYIYTYIYEYPGPLINVSMSCAGYCSILCIHSFFLARTIDLFFYGCCPLYCSHSQKVSSSRMPARRPWGRMRYFRKI